MYNAENIASKQNNETAEYFTFSSDVKGLKNMYSLVFATFALDAVVFVSPMVFVVIFLIILLCKCLNNCCKYLCVKSKDDPQNRLVVPPPQQESEMPWRHWWTFCMYSMLFPLCCLANHLNYIVIAFIHNLYHATSVAIVYGVIIIFLSVMLDRLPYVIFRKLIEKNELNNCLLLRILFLKVIVVILLLGYVTLDILVYFFLPIEEPFEDAANHFISVYSTTAVFFTGLVTYFYVQTHTSPIHIFTKAIDKLFHKDNQQRIINIAKEDWKNLDADDKDVEVAKGLLKKIS